MSGDFWGGDGFEPSGRPLWPSTNDQVRERILAATEAIARAEAERLVAIAEADARGMAIADGATSTKAWLGELLRIKDAHAGQLVKLARAASSDVVAALAAGQMNVDQAVCVVKTVEALPAEVGAEVKEQARAALIGFARQFEPLTLAALGKRILEYVAPEIAEGVLERQLQAEEQKAHVERSLTLRPVGDGRVRVSGVLDVEGAAIVRTGLEALCNPRVAAPSAGSAECGAALKTSSEPGPADVGDVPLDKRTVGQKMADALVEIFKRALAADVLPEHGGRKPQLLLTVPYGVIARNLSYATLDSGELLSASAVRRLACDAGVLPVVLGGKSQVLDVGRERRLYGPAARKALVVRDGGCAFPGCPRPPSWCDIHHIKFWLLGGRTDVDNGVLLCWHHHRVVHMEQWEIRAVRGGRPWFIPPPHVDPARRPRRNPYFQREC